MKKIAVISLFILVFALLYFRAEHPRSHFSRYESEKSSLDEVRDPASADVEKKKP